MTIVQRVVKPKTRRGKKFLENRDPKIVENSRNALFVRGLKCSDTAMSFMKDVLQLKKPMGVLYGRKNDIKPFENTTSLEFYSKKSDASLFMFGSHNKKRPHNIVIGRMFDYQVLDMVELGIIQYKGLKSFKGAKVPSQTKPCLLFAGEIFQTHPDYQRLSNLLTDFFRGPQVGAIRLAGLEHVYMFTAIDGKVFMRSYRIQLKKSGTRTPRIELEEIGPSADFEVKRTKLASDDLYKQAMRQPKEAKPHKKKNVTQDVFGSKMGRVHMTKQDVKKLQTRKMKGLRKTPKQRREERVKRKQEAEMRSVDGSVKQKPAAEEGGATGVKTSKKRKRENRVEVDV